MLKIRDQSVEYSWRYEFSKNEKFVKNRGKFSIAFYSLQVAQNQKINFLGEIY